MSQTGRHAYSLLSNGPQRWIAKQGWSDLRPIQSAAIMSLLEDAPGTSLVISAATASGKALCDFEPVLTTRGWVPIGDIRIGDLAYARDGHPHPVVGKFPQGDCEMVRVSLADGRSVMCNRSHIWWVADLSRLSQGEAAGRARYHGRHGEWPVLHGIGDLREMTVDEMLQEGTGMSVRSQDGEEFQLPHFAVPLTQPVVWGDDDDTDLPSSPLDIGMGLVMGDRRGLDLVTACAKGSVAQRQDLLRGISVSSVCRTGTFGSLSEDDPILREAVIGIARSLGIPTGTHDLVAGFSDGMGATLTEIVGIEVLQESSPMTCISVASPDSTFLTRDYVVTHNTEAAFLPALTMVQQQMQESDENFVYMLYVAPLKALINDQYRRLSEMANPAGIPAYIWHGDAPQGQKAELMREHCGILMTTPESLESFMMNRGQWVGKYLRPLVIVVDEFHAFIGEGRGRQLLSLLDRIDFVNMRHGQDPAVRIGLSATLSQLDKVGRLLSPRRPVAVIDGTQTGKDDSFLAVSTFEGNCMEGRDQITPDFASIAMAIIEDSGNNKTLTFAKSRKDVETISSSINDCCQAMGIRSQAFPHHGSLSKETREALERRLVSTDKPTMAVATVTLELGIDIGDIYEVLQVGAPNSVASLRQRMGRSGRRGGNRRMRCLATLSSPEQMHMELMTLIAEIELMNAGWFEPPSSKRHDVSVLVSEILSVLKQYGTAYPDEIYALLCRHGGFPDVSEELFHSVLRDMEETRLVMFAEDGTCLIAEEGEKEIGDWHFYATFQTEESFSVKAGTRTIGEITPPSTSLARLVGGGIFMLAGRYWEVQDIDMHSRVITVRQTRTRAEFLVPTSRGGGDVNGMVKRKRISLLVGKDSSIVPEYLDEEGKKALMEAREWAKEHRLNALGIHIYDGGEKGSETVTEVRGRLMQGWVDDADVVCVPPVDTPAYDAICRSFELFDMLPGGLENIPLYRLHDLCEASLARREEIEENVQKLIDAVMVDELREREKFNHYLSDATLRMAYVDEVIDLRGAFKWMEAFERFWALPDRRTR